MQCRENESRFHYLCIQGVSKRIAITTNDFDILKQYLNVVWLVYPYALNVNCKCLFIKNITDAMK